MVRRMNLNIWALLSFPFLRERLARCFEIPAPPSEAERNQRCRTVQGGRYSGAAAALSSASSSLSSTLMGTTAR